jgi:hypothetical protein
VKRWGWIAVVLLGVASVAGAAEVDRLNEELREKQLSPDEPIDFISLRKKADAMAARQHSSFKLHQVEIVFEFPSGTPRIDHADFHFFQPAPSGSGPRWEELTIGVATPVKGVYRGWMPGHISGGRSRFDDPRPSPAPAHIIAPEEALRRLNRGPLTSRNQLKVQLYHVGAKYWTGTVGWAPSNEVFTGHHGRPTEEPFFVKTAPRGKWVWWTVAHHDVPGTRGVAAGTRYEYIYMDAVTGNASSHCAEQPTQNTPLVPVPCAPPR